MLLETLKRDPLRARQYLERYVNDGSPSGYSELYRTSGPTDPFNLRPWFHLYSCRGPSAWFRYEGTIESGLLGQLGENWILIHPDMKSSKVIAHEKLSVALEDSFRVVPTASSRTIQVLSSGESDYIKLHYEGILGRVYRSLPFQKAIAGIELSQELQAASNAGRLSENVAFFPETGLIHMQVPDTDTQDGVGMIFRKNLLVGTNAAKCKHVWPLFSLFSSDRLSPMDEPLLVQLIKGSGQDTHQYILKNLLFPLVDFYFDMAIGQGLQIECNAQNIMVGLDEDFSIRAIAIRDLMRCEKDIPIRKGRGLSIEFRSAPYKCIDESDELYTIRHSFSFDFKFSYYVLKPLIEVVYERLGCDTSEILRALREFVHSHCDGLPKGYFPDNRRWFKHERVLLTGERPYVQCYDPLLR